MSETIGEDKGTIAIIDAFTGGTAGVYDGLDQFGRVQNLLWLNYGTSTNVAQIQHGYDYASNRVWRADPIAAANSVYLDEFYAYDGLNQVTDLQRGQLNAGKTGITSTPAWEEAWTLDALGDWSGYVQNVNGATNLNQTRTHDLANKVTQINSSTTHVASDLAGSMTNLPIPGNWNDHYCMVYDAWNRLVGVLASDGTTNIAQYQYDGRNFRTVKKTYTSGTLSETRHFYYNTGWQCLEERLETSGVISSYANRQNVWGQRYVDDLILRDRDADGNSATGSLGVSGSGLEERLYALQDPNWNVVAVSNTTGSIQERYSYTAYGTPTFLTSAFATRTPNSSSYAWDSLYTSRQFDSETGLYQYRNRPYGAELGRFVARDPLRYSGKDFNLYRYCGDDPLTRIDPSGKLWGWDCITAIACGGVSVTTCAAMCGTSYWDDPNDTFGSCWWKCMKAALGEAPAFDAVCYTAITSCIGRQIPKVFPKAPVEGGGSLKPPGWNGDWTWEPPSGEAPGNWRWWDPEGGEWRWHPADKWHPDPHWDHNPWSEWNSPWKNVPSCQPGK